MAATAHSCLVTHATHPPPPGPLTADLQALPESQRALELSWAGMDPVGIEGVALFLSAMPRLSLAVLCEVEGEDEIMEGDPVHCKVWRQPNEVSGWVLFYMQYVQPLLTQGTGHTPGSSALHGCGCVITGHLWAYMSCVLWRLPATGTVPLSPAVVLLLCAGLVAHPPRAVLPLACCCRSACCCLVPATRLRALR